MIITRVVKLFIYIQDTEQKSVIILYYQANAVGRQQSNILEFKQMSTVICSPLVFKGCK